MLRIDKKGNRFWFNKKHEFHRIGGPAIEWNNGDKEWYINDTLYRENGPAIEDRDGDRFWYLNGKEYTEEEYKKKIGEIC